MRELALFNLGIDSKLRGCDLVSLRLRDICHSDQVASQAVVMQHKTQPGSVRTDARDPGRRPEVDQTSRTEV